MNVCCSVFVFTEWARIFIPLKCSSLSGCSVVVEENTRVNERETQSLLVHAVTEFFPFNHYSAMDEKSVLPMGLEDGPDVVWPIDRNTTRHTLHHPTIMIYEKQWSRSFQYFVYVMAIAIRIDQTSFAKWQILRLFHHHSRNERQQVLQHCKASLWKPCRLRPLSQKCLHRPYPCLMLSLQRALKRRTQLQEIFHRSVVERGNIEVVIITITNK